MAARVTLQDIADELGVSRNTVSKAINNTGLLAEGTREKVIRKAIEMGYKQFSYLNAVVEQPQSSLPVKGTAGEIALLTMGFTGNTSYLSVMLDQFQRQFARMGYRFTMHRVSGTDEETLRLPATLDREKVSGIICIEMLDREYCAMLCSLDLPVLFVDAPAAGLDGPLAADLICPDNESGIFGLVSEMVRRGKQRIGFIGEYRHCQSFFERYMAYRNAMYLLGMPCREEYCIIGNKEGVKKPGAEEYQEYLSESFARIGTLPEVFICANDYVAFDVMRVFKRMGIAVPKDVWLCGFDDTMESQIMTPSLTSVHIHSHVMGDCAAYLLSSRIKEPSLQIRRIHTQTSACYRETTGEVQKLTVREQRIPFAISMEGSNSDTIRAIDDVKHGRNLSRSFSSIEELMEDLNAED